MKIHYFQHVPFEDPAFIRTWIRKRRYELSATRFFKKDTLPDANQIDLLVVMGGPMSVQDEQAYPWLKKEKAFIQKMIAANKPVLGICLGAQLIADALGALVYPNTNKEIGWFPVKRNLQTAHPLIKNLFPEEFMAFHWHGDTFDLPDGAVNIGASEACVHQGFIYQNRTIALQFHLESTKKSIEKLVYNCSQELKEGTYIQKKEVISGLLHYTKELNQIMESILTYLTE